MNRPNRVIRRARGKSDPIDAEAAARAALNGVATAVPKARTSVVEAIRVILVARRGAVQARRLSSFLCKRLLIFVGWGSSVLDCVPVLAALKPGRQVRVGSEG